MDTTKNVAHITVRIPADIAESMRQLAQQHDRSLNGELVRAMREYIAKYQQRQEEQGKQKEQGE